MNIKILDLKLIFGFLVLLFPIALLIGPVFAELFLFAIIIYALSITIKKKDYSYFKNNYFIFFFIFSVSTLFSTLYNYYNLDYSLSGIFFFRIPLFAISIWIILDKINLNTSKIPTIYFIFFSIIIFDSIFQFYFGKNILGYKVITERISSFFGDELILGSFLLRIMPIFMFILTFNNIINKKINFLVIFFISLICLIIFLTGERTSFFLLIIFFAVLFLLVKLLRKFILFVALFFIVLATIFSNIENKPDIAPSSRIFKSTFNQVLGKNYENHDNEYKIFGKFYIFSPDHHSHYLLSAKIIKDNFLIGTGVKGFRYLCRNKIYEIKSKNGCSTHPHNTFVQVFTSNGILGFLLLVLAFVFLVTQLLKISIRNNKEIDFKRNNISEIILITGIIINFWPFVPSGNFFNNWISMIYFYPIGLYLHFKNTKKF